MKDLYRGLQLSVGDTETSIRQRIAQPDCSAELRRAAEEILLRPKRRAAYDAAHSTLLTLGQLRTSFGLLTQPLWTDSDNADFSGRWTASASQLDALRASNNPGATKRRQASRQLPRVARLIALGLLALLGYCVFHG